MNLDGLAQLSQFGVANSHLLWCMSLTWWEIESSLSLWWWQWGHTFGPWYRHTLSGSCRNRYLLALLGSFFIGFAKGNPTQNTWPFALCWTNSRMYQEHGAPSSGVWFAHLTLDFVFFSEQWPRVSARSTSLPATVWQKRNSSSVWSWTPWGLHFTTFSILPLSVEKSPFSCIEFCPIPISAAVVLTCCRSREACVESSTRCTGFASDWSATANWFPRS